MHKPYNFGFSYLAQGWCQKAFFMSTILSTVSEKKACVPFNRSEFVTRLLNTDFCPWLNRYVYWLKEPVGWFVVAGLASVLVGLFLSPLGWALAAGLASIIAVGLVFPWLAVRSTTCRLEPLSMVVSEGQAGELKLSVQNRLPIPLWGLAIEGYLAAPIDNIDQPNDVELPPDVVLAQVPPLSRACFRLKVVPHYRGHYPVSAPVLSCSFPFGIWTARRTVSQFERLVVWPFQIPINEECEMSLGHHAEVGEGTRQGDQGMFSGVRPFRQGDRLRSIHWVQSARQGSMIVCERSAPQRATVTIDLDARRLVGNRMDNRDHLAWRVRIAAGLAMLLHGRHTPVRLRIGEEILAISTCSRGVQQAMDRLAAVPLDGSSNKAHHLANADGVNINEHLIRIGVPDSKLVNPGDLPYLVGFQFAKPGRWQSVGEIHSHTLDVRQDLSRQVNEILRRVIHADCVA